MSCPVTDNAMEAGIHPVAVFVVSFRGTSVAMFGMTSCPCLSNDPGGVSPNLVASADR